MSSETCWRSDGMNVCIKFSASIGWIKTNCLKILPKNGNHQPNDTASHPQRPKFSTVALSDLKTHVSRDVIYYRSTKTIHTCTCPLSLYFHTLYLTRHYGVCLSCSNVSACIMEDRCNYGRTHTYWAMSFRNTCLAYVTRCMCKLAKRCTCVAPSDIHVAVYNSGTQNSLWEGTQSLIIRNTKHWSQLTIQWRETQWKLCKMPPLGRHVMTHESCKTASVKISLTVHIFNTLLQLL
jgi:hypothetical protein